MLEWLVWHPVSAAGVFVAVGLVGAVALLEWDARIRRPR